MLSKQELDEILVKRHGKDAQKRFEHNIQNIDYSSSIFTL